MNSLTPKTYQAAICELAGEHEILRESHQRWGMPPLWQAPQGFAGLTLAVLCQQVSLESARAVSRKLEQTIGNLQPASYLAASLERRRAAGLTRQKQAYLEGIAQAIEMGQLELDSFDSLSDNEVRIRLMRCKGIGPWTANSYLLFSLLRTDVWPPGDLALIRAVQERGAPARSLSAADVDKTAEGWRPYRAVAARLLWHDYLCSRGRLEPGGELF